MNKKNLSERDICTKFINPAIEKVGWNMRTQVREEVSFTDGRIIVQGKLYTRGKSKRADYILYYKPNIPIAIIEAKDNKKAVGHGMQQALEYSEILQIPFVFTSNGDSFVFHDKTNTDGTLEKELTLDNFPSPETLWNKYLKYKNIDTPKSKEIVEKDYYADDSGMTPRYYQQNAVNRTLEAVAKGQDKIILVMATGTGKTYTAFNIIWRLWKTGVKKRILFLADRNALLTQTKNGDFSPFGNDIMHIIKNRKIDKSYQIYFALYQGLTSTDESKNAYKEFSKDFFDLVVIDECHRGSASEDSAWREVLTYFDSATQIGLTATPKETKEVSNMEYFGEPVYTYSLKQGISDGFLAPYKVIRITTNVDEGWRPTAGLVDKYGNEVEDRIYNLKDYDRKLAIDERTQVVAKKITEYLKATDRFAKTIVFCVDIDHANRMRQALINENADLVAKHWNYCVKITGDDEVGKQELDNFTDVEERFPVIATTSKMLTTGIDTKMVKVIVLESNIQSVGEFKQIIGRGTRIREAEGKVYFTIMDFRKATNIFARPDFDGSPVQIYEPEIDDPILPPDEIIEPDNGNTLEPDVFKPTTPDVTIDGGDEKNKKYYVNNIPVSVVNERVQYYGKDGKLITESLKDYSRKNITKEYASLDDFIQKWTDSEKKEELIKELAEHGVLLDILREDVGLDLDDFDLICHIAFDQPALTRKERANNVRKRNYFNKYSETAQKILNSLLDKYEQEGIVSIEQGAILKVKPLNQMGSPVELVRAFGKRKDFEEAVKQLEKEIYNIA
ncbi:EcoAI/FtnUII family type I restriction enzme subunit R [Tenacibaculum finnmarkense]|uniref:EcoAI/FtnUII family type I restriction enzme subunit R n=1 Tax=Tenacibaculum finnmarkense TaxID=2781243 RepID=UPI00187B5F0F|nr:DEAD/DEAH box helicase family protein [Tenacibaculum finnmarkense]MBE7646702.1 DEAD/DEAH box helicase family protein [Tenacibaculum finnmarkense genomovar ulcerans]MCG8752623.1 DEAD/DEAH box helicase family protein [Tenacibaculum finnmarkense]MCG8771112.1 DEAD/DEAH box helicase family protein [Tenacibaculum finnmarkense]MCG8873190.1 DEAD/DEAH box helicase family protein [Tenacibaculum finnmarkense]